MNIAMWSGPRNLSTAMMYSFGARGDTATWDEPFYAAYLKATGATHPLAAEIIAAHESDPDVVARTCAGPAPGGKAHFYQKHMTHHMLPGIDRDWFSAVRHVFLIRHPARVVASYHRKNENPTLDDLGFWQQAQIFEEVSAARGKPPVVIDSTDIRKQPEAMLRALCAAIDLPFDPAMLHWPAGPRDSDGVWAKHWYGAVHRSTGFDAAEGPLPELPAHLQTVADAALPSYRALSAVALKP
ncbi:HAD family hydrolase [Oceanibium sediminis]|uniref:sulfotransferase-like domain-containing protein n=1 Tax=Oceanibium sediminis TaxID=2026339 RepID=UPI000DD4CB59|nr:HAD family hydrolase [Oceanibium sediminis]